MKKLVLAFMSIIFCISCTPKKERINGSALVDGIWIDTTTVEWITDTTGLDFVLDTTLQREYLDEPEDSSILNNNKEICSAEAAFKMAEPLLNRAYGKENISFQKPFRINLVDNIWVIFGTLRKATEGVVLGGTAYMEIRKDDGKILKAIHGE